MEAYEQTACPDSASAAQAVRTLLALPEPPTAVLAGNNRASAAEMLGLSRQSLYVKLRRYGIGPDEEA